ncbi:MAG TPA: hypothetical protein VNM24_05180 [Burkholderiales bacterium]|nr:hypothetical protein [Burkholderiales bacterium]
MISKSACAALLAGLGSASIAIADDVAEGENLYRTQCQICHGSITVQSGKRFEPTQRQPVLLAANRHGATTVTDVPHTSIAWNDEAPRVAFAPPFGPNLRGVVGRIAGTAPGFSYSPTFMKTLKGMQWNEAALNVWITDPQAWVPGVYMFYKQPDPEVRRKIIAYLKANS